MPKDPKKKGPSPKKIIATGRKIKQERVAKKSSDIAEATAGTADLLKVFPPTPAAKPEEPKKESSKKKIKGIKPKTIIGSDAEGKPQRPAPLGSPDRTIEGTRQEIMKSTTERALSEIGSEKAGSKYQEAMREVPSNPNPEDIKNKAVGEDPKLTPRANMEELPSEGELARRRAKNAPLATPQKSGIFTGAPTPYQRPESTSSTANDERRAEKGMGVAGEEKGIIEHAIRLKNRNNDVAWRAGKLREKPAVATSYNDVKDTHEHQVAKVMHTMNLSEEQLQSHARSIGTSYEKAIESLHSVVQAHNDFHGKKVKMVPGPGDYWEHPTTKAVIPVSANHPDMPQAFMRTKGKITRVNRGPDGELINTKPSVEGWDSFKAAGGATVWKNYKAPRGIDLVDHLRKEIVFSHENQSSARTKAADRVNNVLASLEGAPKDSKFVGMRERGRAKADTGIPTVNPRPINRKGKPGTSMAYPQDQGQNSVAEALLVPKPPKNTGLPTTGDKPQPVKAKSGKVQVTKGTTGMFPATSSNLATKEPQIETAAGNIVPVKNFMKPVADANAISPNYSEWKGANPNKTMGEVVPTPEKPRLSKRDSDLKKAMRKQEIADLVAKAPSRRDRRMVQPMLPGLENTGGVDLKPTQTAKAELDSSGKPMAGFRGRTIEGLPARPSGRASSKAMRTLAEMTLAGPEKPTTGMDDLRRISAAGAIAKPTPSNSREVAVPSGTPKEKRTQRKEAIATFQKNRPMEQPMLPSGPIRSRQFPLGGVTEKVSDETRALQGIARKPSRRPNALYDQANKILDENKNK